MKRILGSCLCAFFFLSYSVLLTFLYPGGISVIGKPPSGTSSNAIGNENKKATAKRSLLEIRYAIGGPDIDHDTRLIYLDFRMGEWATSDFLKHQYYTFDCSEEIEDAQSPVDVTTVEKTRTEVDMTGEAQGIWRLTFQLKDYATRRQSVCVRWMLFNLPSSQENTIEVNFKQSQLDIHTTDGAIARVDLSAPEPIRIQVNVDGRGRAKVHKEEELQDEL